MLRRTLHGPLVFFGVLSGPKKTQKGEPPHLHTGKWCEWHLFFDTLNFQTNSYGNYWQLKSTTLNNHGNGQVQLWAIIYEWHQKDDFYAATLDCQRVGWSMNGFAMWIMFTVSKNLLKEVHHARPVLLPAGTEYLLNKQPWWTTGAGYCNRSFLHWVVFAWQRARNIDDTTLSKKQGPVATQ